MQKALPVWVAWFRRSPRAGWQKLADFLTESDGVTYLGMYCRHKGGASGVVLRDGETPILGMRAKRA